MDQLLAALAGSDIATLLRFSRWGYAAVNAAHILGIAMLVGAIVPLDLKLLGAWRTVPRDQLARVLVPVAAGGLALAVITGFTLFSVRATEYPQIGVFPVKIALIAVGTASAIALHIAHGWRLESAGPRRLAAAGALSMTCWLGALVCGRMIAFAGD
jgi:hypothetical protein